jgi:hypothetical protein
MKNLCLSFVRFAKVALRRRIVCVLATLFFGIAIASLLTLLFGPPIPTFTDEFAYLLSADTFASGRLSNPTHPMWHHFETFHQIQQPSYASKYPPGQGLVLAIGQLLGHPIIGSILGMGFSMAALAWMLTGWLPKKYNGLIVLFVVCHPGLQWVWGQSYWGGALAMAGSSLMLGSFARLTKEFQIKYAIIASVGVVLLANSRPFEGAVLTAVVGVALLLKLNAKPDWKVGPFLARVILPGFIVLGCGAAWTMTYNHAVTGEALKMPYKVHEETYAWTPLFLWQSAGEKPVHRHPDMEVVYVKDKENIESAFESLGDVVSIKKAATFRILFFFCGGSYVIVILCLPRLLTRPKYGMAFVMAIPVFLAGMATPWEWPHYCAPVVPFVLLILLASWIEVWRLTRNAPRARILLLIGIVAVQIYWTASVVSKQNNKSERIYASKRAELTQQLEESPGRDLVVIRYSVPATDQWVYNTANIDSAEIVWAREISDEAREELIRHFSGRKIWLLDTNAEALKLERLNQ